MPLHSLAIFFLGALGAGGLVWVFVYPILSGERHVERRQASVVRSEPATRAQAAARAGVKTRREQLETTLKEFEERRKKTKNPSLSVRISQAGLSLSPRQFMIISAVLGVVALGVGLGADIGLLPAVGISFAAALGLPRWLLVFLKKRREKRFLELFPDAVDVIVRGIKAGLPVGDCLKIIATETQEPVRSEFQSIAETQAIGMPIGEACQKLYESIPLPEANFFGIVVTIQQRAGGNLSEALGNLSKVLRDRKRMAAKIQAMSMEAKASAGIIGSLPPAVMILVYLSSPDYIELLWTSQTGRLMLAGCALWMFIGVMVMKKMINFDF
jgi:tight adherence protein B